MASSLHKTAHMGTAAAIHAALGIWVPSPAAPAAAASAAQGTWVPSPAAPAPAVSAAQVTWEPFLWRRAHVSCFHSARCDGCCCDGAKSLIRKNRQPGSARGDGGACGGAKSLIRKNRHSGFASACASDGGACGGRACDGAPAMGTRSACASDGGACGGALSRATVAPATVASAMESAAASKASPSPSSAAPCPALLAVGPPPSPPQQGLHRALFCDCPSPPLSWPQIRRQLSPSDAASAQTQHVELALHKEQSGTNLPKKISRTPTTENELIRTLDHARTHPSQSQE